RDGEQVRAAHRARRALSKAGGEGIDIDVSPAQFSHFLGSLVEGLAAIEHERWAHWQRYMHDKCARQADGSLIIPADLVSQWERQLATGYDDLTEPEKESDREQVRRYLPLIEQSFASAERSSC